MKTYNFFKTIYKTLNILVILMMTLNAPLSVFAYTDTDKDDYQPGELVTIFGDNSDGLFYQEGVVVDVVVTGPTPDDHYYCTSEPASAEGSWSCTVTISEDPLIAVGYYSYVTMQNGVVIEEGSFTDAAPPSIEQLWQCDPPTPYDRPTYDCTPGSAVGWVTGNNDGLYYEGDTVSYRTRLSNLKQGDEYSITIEWDTTQSSKHAIDYLKTYNATMENAKPCVGLTKLPAGFDCFTASTWEIPADTFMQSDPDWIANGGFQDPGEFSMFGGTITSVSEYTSPADYLGNTKTSITVFFTAGSTDLVMAWGGHIAERADWGLNNSAVSISGSPYHMRIISWYDVTNNKSLNVGQMDRSLSAEAVVYPGKIIIVKSASPSSETSFPFTAAPSPLYNFSLVDDMDSTDPSWDFLDIKEFKTYTVTENTPYGWALDSIFCSTDSPNGGSTVVNLGTATATIDLKEGEYVTCTFVNTKNLNQDLTVTKTATPAFNRLYKWQIDKSVDDTRIEIAEGGTATFNYSVKVTPNGFVDSNWIVSGSISVTNPNDVDFTGVTITDAIPGGSCLVTDGTNVTVPAMGSVTKSYSCTLTSGGSGTNTATATWDPVVNYSVTGSAQGTAGFDFSSVTPSETNKVITVVDDKTNPGSPVTLGTADWVDGEKTFNYSLDKMGVAGTCTDYTNTAMIDETKQSDSQKVTVCVGKDLTVEKTATASKDRLYKWLIDKGVDETLIKIAEGGKATFNYTVKVTPDGFTDSGYELSGTIKISNPNDWEDITVLVEDLLDKGGTCTIDQSGPFVVEKGKSLNLTYTCTTDGTTIKNTVNVTWNKELYFTPTGLATDDAAVTFALDKETNKVITVVDDKTDPMNPVTLGTADWADGEKTFNYSLDKMGVAGTCTDYTNTAMIDETKQSDSQKVTVCVGKELTVTKTAAGTYDRTYLWDIMKDVDKTYVGAMVGDVITFNYTIKVWQTGISDSNWSLTGKIKVSNPNDWEDIVATITDVYPGGVCTVEGGVDVTVPKGSFVELDYRCTFLDKPSYTGTNTATATWDKATYFTPTGTASGMAEVSFIKDKETNKEIHVTDSYAGALGSVTATDEAPWAEATFTYQRDITAEYTPACMTYDNTATIVETEQSDSASVQICTKYWAFTPGFWKNHTADTRNGHDAWKYTNYATGDLLDDVFDLGVLVGLSPKGTGRTFEESTLLDALRFKGGSGLTGAGEILLRAGVASLLNASFHEKMHGTVVGYFPYSTTEVISKINAVLAIGNPSEMLALAAELDGYNNGWHTIDWTWDPEVLLP